MPLSGERLLPCASARPDLFRPLCAIHKTLVPAASIRPTHADEVQLVDEVLCGAADAALVTLPLDHPDICIEELRRNRLVVCLRKDSPLAQYPALLAADLRDRLSVLNHPKHHPAVHSRLLQLLQSVDVHVNDYASLPCPSMLLPYQSLSMQLVQNLPGTPTPSAWIVELWY